MDTPNRDNASVAEFKSDLLLLELRNVVRKHITTGTPVSIKQADYFTLRQIIGSQFDVHPSAVVLVGSCRLGFTLKAAERYRLAHSSSDLDFAIVSPQRFTKYWDDVYEYSRSSGSWRMRRRFLKTFFQGWIDPRWLPPSKRFESAKRWSEFFDDLMKSRRFGIRRITARLYYSFDFLESYQEELVRECLGEHRRKLA